MHKKIYDFLCHPLFITKATPALLDPSLWNADAQSAAAATDSFPVAIFSARLRMPEESISSTCLHGDWACLRHACNCQWTVSTQETKHTCAEAHLLAIFLPRLLQSWIWPACCGAKWKKLFYSLLCTKACRTAYVIQCSDVFCKQPPIVSPWCASRSMSSNCHWHETMSTTDLPAMHAHCTLYSSLWKLPRGGCSNNFGTCNHMARKRPPLPKPNALRITLTCFPSNA